MRHKRQARIGTPFQTVATIEEEKVVVVNARIQSVGKSN